MRIVLVQPAQKSCADAALWAFYGAQQACEMLGLTYEAISHNQLPQQLGHWQPPFIAIHPGRGQICLNGVPDGEDESLPATALMDVAYEAHFLMPGEAAPRRLPLLGPLRKGQTGQPLGEIVSLQEGVSIQPLFTMSEEGRHIFCLGYIFETIGLYISRFSWPLNPGFQGFVRQIDDLWDKRLYRRWGKCAVVNDYLEILAELLARLHIQANEGMMAKWPHPFREGQIKQIGFLVTHDVDQLFADPSLRQQREQSTNPRFFLPRWREFEEQLGIRSAFYFFSTEPGQRYWLEPNYDISDPPVRTEALKLLAGGWEVSLHQISYDDAEALKGEVAHIRHTLGLSAPTGTRSHYLKHAPHTLSYKAAAGLHYDSTWYAELPESSLLSGTTLPYRPLDCHTAEPVKLWEFPFVIEDGIVFGVYGQGTGRDVPEAIAEGQALIDLAIAHNGYVCFNWHQRTFSQMSNYPGAADCWPPALAGLIEYLRQNASAIWNPLPIELAFWWERRTATRIFSEKDRLQAHNPTSEACPDLVLCIYVPETKGAILKTNYQMLLSHAHFMKQRGSFHLYGLPIALGPHETIFLS